MAEKTKKKPAPHKETVSEKEHIDKAERIELPRRLYRSETNKIIAGVAGGLGEYFNIDPVIVRLLFILFTLIHGSGVLLYIILWVILPKESTSKNSAKTSHESFHENIHEFKDEFHGFAQNMRINRQNNTGSWFGAILVIFGLLILMDNLGFQVWLGFDKLWPVLLILAGFAILSR